MLARPVDPAPVQLPVDGTFSTGSGAAAVPVRGTLTVQSFVEQDVARELCRVVQAAAKNPAGQSAPARALNKVPRSA